MSTVVYLADRRLRPKPVQSPQPYPFWACMLIWAALAILPWLGLWWLGRVVWGWL